MTSGERGKKLEGQWSDKSHQDGNQRASGQTTVARTVTREIIVTEQVRSHTPFWHSPCEPPPPSPGMAHVRSIIDCGSTAVPCHGRRSQGNEDLLYHNISHTLYYHLCRTAVQVRRLTFLRVRELYSFRTEPSGARAAVEPEGK